MPSPASPVLVALLACATAASLAAAQPQTNFTNAAPCPALVGVVSTPPKCFTDGVSVPLQPGATIQSWPERLPNGAQCAPAGAGARMTCPGAAAVECTGTAAFQWTYTVTADSSDAAKATSCAVV
jgi:hypothetical protein